jgi:Protein of unknown function (DUF2865)
MADLRPAQMRFADTRKGLCAPSSLKIGVRDLSVQRKLRMAALAGLGLSLGAGASLLAVSLVQAENDSGIRDVQRGDFNSRRGIQATAPTQRPVYSSYVAAPAQNPLSNMRNGGQLFFPSLNLNPFKQRADMNGAAKRRVAKQAVYTPNSEIAVDTVSGAANVTRTICVRMCDGFHAPLGYLDSASDLPGHEALCKAMNPGVPVKLFKVAAGETDLDKAVSSDGKTYGSLPVAYAHEKSADPACRPAITTAQRVSLLRDFTLRAGDAVVVGTSARVFNGGTKYPYAASDFRDFRSSELLSAADRQRIDNIVGASRADKMKRDARNAIKRREASNLSGMTANDADPVLRGSFAASDHVALRVGPDRTMVRIIPLATQPR